MAFGFRVNDSNGNTVMDTETFGFQIIDDFVVPHSGTNSSGSNSYPGLNYFSRVYVSTIPEIAGLIYSRSITSSSTKTVTVGINASTTLSANQTAGAFTTINVVDTTGFASSGRIFIQTNLETVSAFDYTSTTATSFIGIAQTIANDFTSGTTVTDNIPVVAWATDTNEGEGSPYAGNTSDTANAGPFTTEPTGTTPPNTRIIVMAT